MSQLDQEADVSVGVPVCASTWGPSWDSSHWAEVEELVAKTSHMMGERGRRRQDWV